MRTVAEHLAQVVALVAPCPPVRVPVADADGLVLAVDLVAADDLPRWDNSAMDGYAVRAADTAGAPARTVVLDVVGDLPAGTDRAPAVGRGQAARIMTGAPLPPGADAVVPVEDTDGGLVSVRVDRAVPPGRHVRRAGEDLRRGDVVLHAGTELTPARLGAAAAAGHGSVQVHRRPRVAVVATGDELVPAGEPTGPGQIHDSNSVLLAAAATRAGAQVVHRSAVGDTPAVLAELLAGLAPAVDLVLTAGGVSMGAYEVVRDVLEGGGVQFAAVAMQPGKPQGLGRLVGGTPVLCLPGNPVSVHVSFAVFGAPAVRVLRGLVAASPVVRATVTEGWTPPPDRAQYMPVVLGAGPDGWQARRATAAGSGSHLAARLALADGLLVVPVGTGQVRAGQTYQVMMHP